MVDVKEEEEIMSLKVMCIYITITAVVVVAMMMVAPKSLCGNIRGEPVFSVMAAGWFCEKSG
jgi:hypothetical protein